MLTIHSSVVGTFEFYVVYKSTASLLQISKKIQINVKYYCLTMTLNPVLPLFTFHVQKNKLISGGYIETLKTSSQVVSMWSTPSNSSCSISEWYVSLEGTTANLSSADSNYARLQQPGPLLIDPLVLNNQNTQWGNEYFKFNIQIYVGTNNYKTLYPNPALVEYDVGCWEEQLTTLFNLKTSITYPFYVSFNSTYGLRLIYPKIPTGEVTVQLKLSEIFLLSQDYAWCDTYIQSY